MRIHILDTKYKLIVKISAVVILLLLTTFYFLPEIFFLKNGTLDELVISRLEISEAFSRISLHYYDTKIDSTLSADDRTVTPREANWNELLDYMMSLKLKPIIPQSSKTPEAYFDIRISGMVLSRVGEGSENREQHTSILTFYFEDGNIISINGRTLGLHSGIRWFFEIEDGLDLEYVKNLLKD